MNPNFQLRRPQLAIRKPAIKTAFEIPPEIRAASAKLVVQHKKFTANVFRTCLEAIPLKNKLYTLCDLSDSLILEIQFLFRQYFAQPLKSYERGALKKELRYVIDELYSACNELDIVFCDLLSKLMDARDNVYYVVKYRTEIKQLVADYHYRNVVVGHDHAIKVYSWWLEDLANAYQDVKEMDAYNYYSEYYTIYEQALRLDVTDDLPEYFGNLSGTLTKPLCRESNRTVLYWIPENIMTAPPMMAETILSWIEVNTDSPA